MWAQTRVDSGEEPPWTFHKLKLLAELSAELAEGLQAGVAYAPGQKDENAERASENVIKLDVFRRPDEDPSSILPA